MKRFASIARWFLVTVGIVVLTSFTVDATLSGNSLSQSALGILATSVSGNKGCPEGTVSLGGDFDGVCVDIFEASPGDRCPVATISGAQHTRQNMNEGACAPVSAKDKDPWIFVTLHQAQELCGRTGKRLLSNAEWYRASLGSPDLENGTTCALHEDTPVRGGAYERCVSGAGVYDMVGNVWEWVDAQVENSVYEGRDVPESGYVAEADGDGVVTKTSDVGSLDYHSDYFWSEREGLFGMLRGGFYGSGNDAGVYSIQAKTVLSFAGNAIGFRCASDIKK